MQALASASKVVRSTESYVGCRGEQFGDLQTAWTRALHSDEGAASALLEAWAATVAAQERLQMSVDSGLLERFSDSAAVWDKDARGIDCSQGLLQVARDAHRVG